MVTDTLLQKGTMTIDSFSKWLRCIILHALDLDDVVAKSYFDQSLQVLTNTGEVNTYFTAIMFRLSKFK
jgi:hypothetical protein